LGRNGGINVHFHCNFNLRYLFGAIMITIQLFASTGLLATRQASDEEELNKFRKQLNDMMYRWEQNYPSIGRLTIKETGKLHDWLPVNAKSI
jgi:hypothetical protein